jgi:hypothetical protein
LSTLHNIGFRIAYALAAGLVIGLLDLWVYELSWRGFFAGLVAGVAYALVVVFLAMPGMGRYPRVLFGLAIFAGSIGATAWWLVCRGSPLWMAIAVGSVLALAHFASQGLFSRA